MGECRFSKAWIGFCKKPTDGEVCEEHAKVKCCVCGEQATSECAHTAQFVCGAPLCDNCHGVQDHSKGYGFFGFGGHGHERIKVG